MLTTLYCGLLMHVVWCGKCNDFTLLCEFALPYCLMWNVLVIGMFSQVIDNTRSEDTYAMGFST